MPQTARLIRPCNVLRPPPDDQRDQEPSAKLTARTNAQSALNGLFLSLGAISPLVAAVGVSLFALAAAKYRALSTL